MATRITSKNYKRKAANSGARLAPQSRKNKKCRNQSLSSQSEEINTIFLRQKQLANKNLALDIDIDSGANENAYSILNSLGISVEADINDINYSFKQNAGIDHKKLEKFSKTQDKNPNRIQVKKLQNLQNLKISSKELFNDSITNPIFELDACTDNVRSSKRQQLTNVISVTNQMLNRLIIPPSGDGNIGGFKDASGIADINLRRDNNVQTTGTGRGTTGAQGDGRGGVDNAFGSGVTNRGSSY
jgi:hypothetical protein